ncbi:MAG: LLM class flavin-dependent oxidoreductase [Nitriliruptorales bacterium]|nr:LLM class flavin-dependent oxidoreductase [Nitriliruptorales bacterium]
MKTRNFSDDRMRLGLFWPSARTMHWTSKAVADRNPDVMDLAVHIEIAKLIEDIGLDYAFLADRYSPYTPASTRVGHQDPCILAYLWGAAIASHTRHIGIITTIHTTYLHPAHVARIGANLDVMSAGRWGMNIVTGFTANEQQLFGHEGLVDHTERYALADELISAVKELWRADEDIEFAGEALRFRGHLSGPRPVQQPWPLLVNAGASPSGQRFAVRQCDYVFTVGNDASQVSQLAGNLDEQAAEVDRKGEVLPMISVMPLIRDSQAEAEDEMAWISANIDTEAARAFAVSLTGGIKTYTETYKDVDEAVLLDTIGNGAGLFRIAGTPEQVAEQMADLYENSKAGGMLLSFPFWSPSEIGRMGDVLAILEKSGSWSHPKNAGWSW